MSISGLVCCLHGSDIEHILKADATGPKVPAIIGNPVDRNHQYLGRLCVRHNMQFYHGDKSQDLFGITYSF